MGIGGRVQKLVFGNKSDHLGCGTFVKMHLVKSVFDEIEKILHFARLPLSVRKHKYYIRCKDTKPIEAK